MPGRDHCEFHGVCLGVTRDGRACGSRSTAEFNYLYCCIDHVPGRRSTPTQLFRIDGLRATKGQAVREYRDNIDAYTSDGFNPLIPMELDHVLELHFVRDAYDSIVRQGTNFTARKEMLRQDLRDVANRIENLNYTSPDINNAKFRAFWTFQDDYRNNTGLQTEQGLFPYLALARSESSQRKLKRSESKSIQREVLASYDKIIGGLRDEDPLHDQVIGTLHDTFTAMRLN